VAHSCGTACSAQPADPDLLAKTERLRQEGQLTATRASLRRVLAGRQLTPSKDDDARIDACTDLATLERWLDRAIHATSVSDALQ
jgi:hypothetical protein